MAGSGTSSTGEVVLPVFVNASETKRSTKERELTINTTAQLKELEEERESIQTNINKWWLANIGNSKSHKVTDEILPEYLARDEIEERISEFKQKMYKKFLQNN
jgi:isochorismate hydrolase